MMPMISASGAVCVEREAQRAGLEALERCRALTNLKRSPSVRQCSSIGCQ